MKYLIGILTFISYLESFSQKKTDIVGVYHEAGIAGDGGGGVNYYILENNNFIILAYATVIYGKWEVKDNHTLTLYPNITPSFKIYGRYNPNIKEEAKIMFQNFETGNTFIQINGKEEFMPVFNEDANCVSYPSVANFSKKIESIALAMNLSYQDSMKEEYKFQVHDNYNDFVAIYHSNKDTYRPFIFEVTPKGLTSNRGKLMKKMSLKTIEEEEKKYITEIQQSFEAGRNYLYSNHLYNFFDKYDIEIDKRYIFDKNKNAYYDKLNYKQNEENGEKDYNRDTFLYKYLELPCIEKVKKQINITKQTLFYATCK
ncbi:hypothetical protein AD998_02780 [bacterium 336/3]|nr:hypothetical protein AD998_02780 [bacterium 336/3]